MKCMYVYCKTNNFIEFHIQYKNEHLPQNMAMML